MKQTTHETAASSDTLSFHVYMLKTLRQQCRGYEISSHARMRKINMSISKRQKY